MNRRRFLAFFGVALSALAFPFSWPEDEKKLPDVKLGLRWSEMPPRQRQMEVWSKFDPTREYGRGFRVGTRGVDATIEACHRQARMSFPPGTSYEIRSAQRGDALAVYRAPDKETARRRFNSGNFKGARFIWSGRA